ncbi:MAG: FkbM family methyltransferase [Bacteroidetes bacterium]|nr:FkbM family methyltransferase [Bacteroidota bacterium]
MEKIVLLLYKILPSNLIFKIGKSDRWEAIRKLVLRPKGKALTTKVNVNWKNTVQFLFTAPVKIALKAEERGLESRLLKETIEEFKGRNDLTILDIGASFGFLTMVWSKTIASQGKIYSFEPHPFLFDILNKNINDNSISNICSPFQYLVGDSNSVETLKLMGFTSNKYALSGKTVSEEIQVKQVTIDDFIDCQKVEEIDLIKIDVDGSELQVLKGMRKLLKMQSPLLVVETSQPAVMQWLKAEGYAEQETCENTFHEGNPVNLFFKKKLI